MAYLEEGAEKKAAEIEPVSLQDIPLPDIIIEDLCIRDEKGMRLDHIRQFQTVVLQVKTRRPGPPLKGHLGFGLERPDGQLVFGATTKKSGMNPFEFTGKQALELVIPSIPLLGGSYRVRAVVSDQYTLRAIHEAKTEPFPIISDHPEFGMFTMVHHWRVPE
jgi:hypothetical protein